MFFVCGGMQPEGIANLHYTNVKAYRLTVGHRLGTLGISCSSRPSSLSARFKTHPNIYLYNICRPK